MKLVTDISSALACSRDFVCEDGGEEKNIKRKKTRRWRGFPTRRSSSRRKAAKQARPRSFRMGVAVKKNPRTFFPDHTHLLPSFTSLWALSAAAFGGWPRCVLGSNWAQAVWLPRCCVDCGEGAEEQGRPGWVSSAMTKATAGQRTNQRDWIIFHSAAKSSNGLEWGYFSSLSREQRRPQESTFRKYPPFCPIPPAPYRGVPCCFAETLHRNCSFLRGNPPCPKPHVPFLESFFSPPLYPPLAHDLCICIAVSAGPSLSRTNFIWISISS